MLGESGEEWTEKSKIVRHYLVEDKIGSQSFSETDMELAISNFSVITLVLQNLSIISTMSVIRFQGQCSNQVNISSPHDKVKINSYRQKQLNDLSIEFVYPHPSCPPFSGASPLP